MKSGFGKGIIYRVFLWDCAFSVSQELLDQLTECEVSNRFLSNLSCNIIFLKMIWTIDSTLFLLLKCVFYTATFEGTKIPVRFLQSFQIKLYFISPFFVFLFLMLNVVFPKLCI